MLSGSAGVKDLDVVLSFAAIPSERFAEFPRLRAGLAARRKSSAFYLARKPVVLLDPPALRGTFAWRGLDEPGLNAHMTPARTVVTILRTAAASGGVPFRSANSRCAAPISVGASVSMSASAAMRPRPRSKLR
jgi:hypothetical protein